MTNIGCLILLWHLQVRQFESVNFVDFVRLLAAFSDRAAYDDKVKFVFKVYDVDGDGKWCTWVYVCHLGAVQSC